MDAAVLGNSWGEEGAFTRFKLEGMSVVAMHVGFSPVTGEEGSAARWELSQREREIEVE
jgi:hypothetical protein